MIAEYSNFHIALAFIAGVGIGIYIDIYILDRYYKMSLKMGFDEVVNQYKRIIAKKCNECDENCQNKDQIQKQSK